MNLITKTIQLCKIPDVATQPLTVNLSIFTSYRSRIFFLQNYVFVFLPKNTFLIVSIVSHSSVPLIKNTETQSEI